MPSDIDLRSARLERTLKRYDESLLRRVSEKLFRPRSHWPADELIERCIATMDNAAVIDRRIQSLEVHARRLLALISHSRQLVWRVGNLVELLASLDSAVNLTPVLDLFESGLLYPVLPPGNSKIKDFETWLAAAAGNVPEVFAHPGVIARAVEDDLGLPECPSVAAKTTGPVHEADGLEWPLRLDVLWQQARAMPLRRTQSGEFFKRDLDRLRTDPLLNAPPADSLSDIPDMGLLVAELALTAGIVQESSDEMQATPTGSAPWAPWEAGPYPVLETLWAALPRLDTWTPQDGWRGKQTGGGNPYPSACLLAILMLSKLSGDAWGNPEGIAQAVVERHPFWAEGSDKAARQRGSAALVTFLLGLAYQLRMVQATKSAKGSWLIRLSPTGRWLLGLEPMPAAPASYQQTLMVQPNLEIIAYRQGLTPALIARLGDFASWKNLSSACALQLEPDTVYRALEAGQSFETIRQTLEQHGMRATPTAVIEALRTWSNKRERLCVFPAATLLEFATPEDLNDALARGLPATRLSDCLAVVAREDEIDYRHFKLAGTRDYGLAPEKCVEVEDDGVTLHIDIAKSDLLLETEMQRFAEPVKRVGTNGRRSYRMTPATLSAARERGVSLNALSEWFLQRTGRALPAAARLLLTSAESPPLEMRRQLVLHVSSEDTADGLMQWPETRALIEMRLGPTSLLVAEENAEALSKRLAELGMSVRSEKSAPV
jgi:hypothetical protein